MMRRIAILGANGFIGSRAVEWLHLGGRAEVRPVVRSRTGLARLSRFDLDCRVADACDPSALRAALEGCDAVIHAVSGAAPTIARSVTASYRAAEAAGLQRLVYLSSASVHGQAPKTGTDENSPLSDRQAIPYNNAKVRAERQLRKLRASGTMQLVILRPGIVTGPRSSWQSSFAASLLSGMAYWVNAGRGICNSVYVDNLIHAIQLALTVPAADGEAFLVADEETVTWADLYRPIADALGIDLAQVSEVRYRPERRHWRDLVDAVRQSARGQAMLSHIPTRLRRVLRAALEPPAPASSSPWAHSHSSTSSRVSPQATLEMSLLYQCACKLPDTKARTMLGYRPIVSFAEGSRRTVGWLEFAGYPVSRKRPASDRNG